MSVVTVAEVKLHLRLTHNEDDALLALYVDGAEAEAIKYLGGDSLPRRGSVCPDCSSEGEEPDPVSDGDDIEPNVRSGIFLLVQAMYEGKEGAAMESTREVAFKLMRPFRCGWGV